MRLIGVLACVLALPSTGFAQISRISAASNSSTTVTIGTHQAGDAICIFAFNDTSTVPTTPAPYNTFQNRQFNNANSAMVVGCQIADSGSETSGTWTNAERVVALVYRGVKQAHDVTAGEGESGGTGTTITWDHDANGQAMSVTNGTSWLIGCGASETTEDLDTNVPSGMTNIAGSTATGGAGEMTCHDTNAPVSGFTDTTTTGHTSSEWVTMIIELLAEPAAGGCSPGSLSLLRVRRC